MTAKEAINSIEPGSTESGDRGALEQGLQEVLGAPPAEGGAPGAGGAGPVPSANDPLGALLGGGVHPGNEDPLTSGLSVGPGGGPPADDPMQSPKAVRLRIIAEHAKTPALKLLAIRMLKRMAINKEAV